MIRGGTGVPCYRGTRHPRQDRPKLWLLARTLVLLGVDVDVLSPVEMRTDVVA